MNLILRICSLACALLCSVLVYGQDRGIAVSIAWSPDGDTIAVGSTTGIWLFDAEFEEVAHVGLPEFPDNAPNTLDWNASGDLLALGYHYGSRTQGAGNKGQGIPILIVDIYDQDVVSTIEVKWLYSTIRWHPAENHLLAGTLNGTTHIWDAMTGQELFYFEESFGREHRSSRMTQSVCWLTESTIASIGGQATYILDVQEHKTLETVEDTPFVLLADCNQDGEIMMVLLSDVVVDARDVKRRYDDTKELRSANEIIRAADVAWSPNGSQFVTNSTGCRVHVFDGQSKQVLAELEGSFSDFFGLPHYVDSVAWHPDGTRFAVVGQFDIRMWDSESFELLHHYDGFKVGYDQGIRYAVELSEEERKKEMEEHGVMCPAPSVQKHGAEKG